MSDILSVTEFLLESFEVLGRRKLAPGQIDALRLPNVEGFYSGVSSDREFFLLFRIDETTLIEQRRLRSLTVSAGDSFTVHDAASGAEVMERFAVVRLRNGHEGLLNSFAIVAATLIAASSPKPAPQEITELLDNLVALLADARHPSESVLVGLWGELWVIAYSPDVEGCGRAWHADPSDRYDFSFSQVRLEVKTTLGKSRTHDFSLEQLKPDASKETWIGSLQVVRDPSGESVLDLLQAVIERTSPATAARVTRLALATLAGDIESAQDFCLAPIGLQPLQVFKAQSIPRVVVPEGRGITSVRFSVDLSDLTPHLGSLEALATEL